MRKTLAFTATVLLAGPAFSGLDLSAVASRVDAQASATTGAVRRSYAALRARLARPDRPGLIDDFGKLRRVADALEGRLEGDAALSAALNAQLAAGLAAVSVEAADLVDLSQSLDAAHDRARCDAAAARARRFADRAAAAQAGGRARGCASLARGAASAYETGAALATRLLARQNRRNVKWSVPLSGLGGALLSVWAEPGRTPAVYVVGADAKDGTGPIFLRMGAEGWVRVPIASSGTLWRASGVGGEVFAAGTGGRVVRYDPPSGGVTDLSVGADATLYGVWGSSTSDLWAVGGNTDGTSPATALFHYDGAAWTPVAPPPAAAGRALYNVWGAAADDVWACGQGGLVMHFDGAAWTGQTYAPHEDLFAVHGTQPTVAVGGAVQPTVVEGGPSGFAPAAAPSGSGALRDVFVPTSGDPWACGLAGDVLRRANASWRAVAGVPAVAGNDFHAVCIDDAGGVYLAGGDLAQLDQGALLYYGPHAPPTEVLPQAKLSEKIAPLFSADRGVYRAWTCSVGGCHVAATPSADLNLLLDPHAMRAQLVGVASSQSPLLRVSPGRPSQSYLMRKLDGTMTSVGGSGERMPFGGPYLSQDDMDAVRAWILEGARDN